MFREHGQRTDRQKARVMWLIEDWGVDKVRDTLAQLMGRTQPLRRRGAGEDRRMAWKGRARGLRGLCIRCGPSAAGPPPPSPAALQQAGLRRKRSLAGAESNRWPVPDKNLAALGAFAAGRSR